ncbi:MAG: hypothetical protein WC004_05305, partial [Candidatus Absconditabacterales bacterium]
MTKNNVPAGLRQAQTREYDPEQFGLTQEFVYCCRQQLFAKRSSLEQGLVKESDGLFLYAWSLLAD